jgi:hypothetical protein
MHVCVERISAPFSAISITTVLSLTSVVLAREPVIVTVAPQSAHRWDLFSSAENVSPALAIYAFARGPRRTYCKCAGILIRCSSPSLIDTWSSQCSISARTFSIVYPAPRLGITCLSSHQQIGVKLLAIIGFTPYYWQLLAIIGYYCNYWLLLAIVFLQKVFKLLAIIATLIIAIIVTLLLQLLVPQAIIGIIGNYCLLLILIQLLVLILINFLTTN